MVKRNQYPKRIYTETQASCGKCNSLKDITLFSKDKSSSSGISYWCRECASKNSRENYKKRLSKNPSVVRETARNRYIKTKHGITLQQYKEKLARQNNSCAICGVKLSTSGSYTHLDHDHKTGKLRDFLCTNCNRGLGHFKDNENLLLKAAQYLNTHNNHVEIIKEVLVNESSH